MKQLQRIGTVLIILALICCVFAGCTPDEEQTESQSIPVQDSKSETAPVSDSKQGVESSQVAPPQTDPSGETPETSTREPEGTMDPGGLEIESEATHEIGQHQGFGGN